MEHKENFWALLIFSKLKNKIDSIVAIHSLQKWYYLRSKLLSSESVFSPRWRWDALISDKPIVDCLWSFNQTSRKCDIIVNDWWSYRSLGARADSLILLLVPVRLLHRRSMNWTSSWHPKSHFLVSWMNVYWSNVLFFNYFSST